VRNRAQGSSVGEHRLVSLDALACRRYYCFSYLSFPDITDFASSGFQWLVVPSVLYAAVGYHRPLGIRVYPMADT
jgi:hypothetical protein